MPYVVIDGKVKRNGVVYGLEQTVPAMKNALADLAALGIVEWRDSRTHQAEGNQDSVYAGLSKKELLARCKERELEIPRRAKVTDLVALLLVADAESADEGQPEEKEQTDAGESGDSDEDDADTDAGEDETADESEDSQE